MQMPDAKPATPSLLFVIDRDFGSLGLVMYLLHKQPLAIRAKLIMPRIQFDLHAGGLSVAALPYDSVDDVITVIETEKPGSVLLFSGYSFVDQNLFDYPSLRRLIDTIHHCACTLATSDPYLGTYTEIPHQFWVDGAMERRLMPLLPRLARSEFVSRLDNWIFQRKVIPYRRIAALLEDAIHLCANLTACINNGSIQYRSFYNSQFLREDTELQSISNTISAFSDVSSDWPRWLFVIANFDLEYQRQLYGDRRFSEIVVEKMRDAIACRKHPTLIASPTLIDDVALMLGDEPNASFVQQCGFAEFELRLLDAEIAFYWQLYSTSSFLRLMNGLPVFFFDQGHVQRLLPRLYETGLEFYFIADPPIMLDASLPLVADELLAYKNSFAESAAKTQRQLQAVLSPEELFAELLDDQP